MKVTAGSQDGSRFPKTPPGALDGSGRFDQTHLGPLFKRIKQDEPHMKYILIFSLGFLLSDWMENHLVFYRVNCDMTRFSDSWVNAKELKNLGFSCYKSNAKLDREVSTPMLLKLWGLNGF